MVTDYDILPNPDFVHRKKIEEAVKEKLLPVTIYKQERLYTMYSCTAVFFEDDTMYIKAGTEPAGYLKQMFSIM